MNRSLSIASFEYSDTDYNFVSEKRLIHFTLKGTSCDVGEMDESYPSLFSDDKKIFLRVSGSQYHLLYDTLGTILFLFEKDPKTLFVLDVRGLSHNSSITNLKDFFFKILDHNGIRYNIFKDNLKEGLINVNNFYNRVDNHSEQISHNNAKNISSYSMPFIKNKDAIPHKKIYLSRRLVNSEKERSYGQINPVVQLTDKNFNRIDDELELEILFKDLGFEIVYPENFKTFEDQINFFYEVKTLISLSGAGLTNAIFMQDGGNVVELFTSHWIWRLEDAIPGKKIDLSEAEHFFYNSLAFEKNHDYIAINNKDKNAKKIINKFKTKPIFKALGL